MQSPIVGFGSRSYGGKWHTVTSPEKMIPQIKVSLKILPFDRISIQISGTESPVVDRDTKKRRYIEPLIKNVGNVDIHFVKMAKSIRSLRPLPVNQSLRLRLVKL